MGGDIHIILAFAGEIILPPLMRHPGQIHFRNGIKFDCFGVSSRNFEKKYINGLPEGHWPGGYTWNAFSILLQCTLLMHLVHLYPFKKWWNFHFLADNCAGQNMNQFMIYSISWRAIIGYEDIIKLRYLVSGHTKN